MTAPHSDIAAAFALVLLSIFLYRDMLLREPIPSPCPSEWLDSEGLGEWLILQEPGYAEARIGQY